MIYERVWCWLLNVVQLDRSHHRINNSKNTWMILILQDYVSWISCTEQLRWHDEHLGTKNGWLTANRNWWLRYSSCNLNATFWPCNFWIPGHPGVHTSSACLAPSWPGLRNGLPARNNSRIDGSCWIQMWYLDLDSFFFVWRAKFNIL